MLSNTLLAAALPESFIVSNEVIKTPASKEVLGFLHTTNPGEDLINNNPIATHLLPPGLLISLETKS